MYEQVEKPKEKKSQSVSNVVAQKQGGGESTFQLVDNRPESLAQRKMQTLVNKHSVSKPFQKKEIAEKFEQNVSSTVQRVLEIDGHRFEKEEEIRDKAFEAAGATAQSVEGLVYVGTDPEVIARFGSWEEATLQYDHTDIMDPLALAHDPEDPVVIPALIHFIWMGRPPGKVAIDNIVAWADRANNTAWRINLWTDAQINLGNWEKTIASLKGKIELQQIRPILDPGLLQAYIEAVENSPKAFNLASDIARYSILRSLGGVYADVDLGPGDVDLQHIPVLSSVDIPITAPQVRDQRALNEQLSPEELQLPLPQQIDLAASRAYSHNQLNNNLMIIGSNSDFIKRLINKVAQKIAADKSREMWSENAALISGPQAVIVTMFEMLGGGAQRLIDAMEPRTFQNWCRLQWLTAESESQQYDTSSSKPKEKNESGSDKECFLTTACVEVMGLDDDCEELTILRSFRDGYMRTQDDGIRLIEEYYRIAPGIVAALKSRPDFRERARDLYNRLVIGSIRLIQNSQNREAIEHYCSVVRELQKETEQKNYRNTSTQ